MTGAQAFPELPPSAFTRRQASIADRLRRHIGVGPSLFFVDACGLLAENPPRSTMTHLVSYLLRELESAIRSVIESLPKQGTQRASVISVLGELGIPEGEPAAEFWLSLTEGDAAGLAARTHRPGLDAPRPASPEFEEFTENMEELLDRVLRCFEDRYVEVFGRLDALLGEPHPARAHARRLRQNFPQNLTARAYFFSKAGQDWLAPLTGEGFFEAPPEPVVDEAEGTVQLPMWPQSQFLVRIAASQPEAVVTTALGIPATNNSRVNSDIVEVALRVPAGQSARLLPRVTESLGRRFGVLVPGRIGRLCRHLAEGGLPEDSLTLARALLNRVPDETAPRAAMDSWSYAEVLREDMPAIARAAGMPALALLGELLDQAVGGKLPGRSRELQEDMSVTWLPALPGHHPGTDRDPAVALASAVRDTAGLLVESGSATVGEVVAELESREWPIFRRLALHILDARGQDEPELVGAHLSDPAAICDYNLNREFVTLARDHCRSISSRDQQRLLALIGKGPDTSKWSKNFKENTGQPMPEAMIRDRVSRWQRDRFAAIEPILTPPWRAVYTRLVAEHGEAEDPTASTPLAVRDITFASPATADDLSATTIQELVDFLATWEPSRQLSGPSQFALASALGSSIQQDAERRSSEAEAFIGLPPAYIAAILSGLWQAARGGTSLDWSPVLRLCTWADQQATADLSSPCAGDWPQWRDTRLNTLRLLASGLQTAGTPIATEHQVEIWAIIEHSSHDPDPLPDYEERATESGQGPELLVLNHVRPQALNTAISYAWWTRAHDPDAGISEVLELLGHHLNPDQDPSRAVRWVYGAYFPQLAALDRAWATENAPRIFPPEDAHRQLWEAAWDAYLTHAGVNTDAWEILRGFYEFAVGLLDPAATERPALARAYGLGQHLVTRYWAGQITFDSYDQILCRYYQKTPSSVRVDLMRYIGRGLHEGDELDPALADRLREFWDARVHAVRDGSDPRELKEFGEWFAAGKLGDEWELRQILTAISDAGNIEAEYTVLPRLATLSAAHTTTCLAILHQWVRASPNFYWLQREEASVRTILEAGLDSGDPADRETVTAVISRCIEEGMDFRDILDRRS